MPDKRPLLASLDAVCLSAPRASANVARPCLDLRRRFIENYLSLCLDQVMLSQRGDHLVIGLRKISGSDSSSSLVAPVVPVHVDVVRARNR